MPQQHGTLYIVATPIGNLGDISQRAIETLKSVDLIFAEDTRNTRKLLTHFGIKTAMQSLHEHNEAERSQQILQHMQAGKQIALVSDAGTPLISDPGYRLVQIITDEGLSVVPIPGPSALITALSVAGLSTERFTFEGFLPAKPAAKKQLLLANETEPRTQVYYESSHRIVATAKTLLEVTGGERPIVLARELTKLYEEIFRGSVAELNDWITSDPNHSKGEFVIVLAGKPETASTKSEIDSNKVLSILLEELPVKQAASLAAKITGQSKNNLYKQAMQLKKDAANE